MSTTTITGDDADIGGGGVGGNNDDYIVDDDATTTRVTERKTSSGATGGGGTASNIPWVERYRPKVLNDVSHQNEVIQALQNAVKTNRLPHLLFYGKPGTGKTSVALALCRELFSPDQIKFRVLELNASDERGISVVRDKIKHFASLAVGDSSYSHASGGVGENQGTLMGMKKKKKKSEEEDEEEEEKDDDDELKKVTKKNKKKKYPNPPYKIIILDEADTVTPDAQSALRRIIEAHSRITRFILICNYVTRIIEPLASRCAKFRFQSLPVRSMKERLNNIAKEEQCRFDSDKERDEAIEEILELSGGDMRRAVTMLQSAHSLTGWGQDGSIQAKSIAEMAGIPPPKLISTLYSSLHSKSFSQMEQTVHDILAEGYAVPTILSFLFKRIVSDDKVSDWNKAKMSIKIAEVDKYLIDGANETLQLLAVCSLAVQCFSSSSGD